MTSTAEKQQKVKMANGQSFEHVHSHLGNAQSHSQLEPRSFWSAAGVRSRPRTVKDYCFGNENGQ